jgi:S1-C subfamily serine protease
MDDDWQIPIPLQPTPEAYDFDLDGVLRSVVGVQSQIPGDAFTAQTLGTERAGSGVVIRDDGLVLTIGYLITEAETIWLTSPDGGGVQGHVVAVDQATGFGLVQPLARLNLPAIPLGNSAEVAPGTAAVIASSGGRQHSVSTEVVGRERFAGYWEYVLDRPIFTAPPHPFWGGAGLFGTDGKLLGIGSLILQQREADGRDLDLNMVVPIELLPPILDDLLLHGRSDASYRPWLGVYCAERGDHIHVQGLAPGGPAERADIRNGDRIVAVGGVETDDLADLWHAVWASGPIGSPVTLTIGRGRSRIAVTVATGERSGYLKAPRLH